MANKHTDKPPKAPQITTATPKPTIQWSDEFSQNDDFASFKLGPGSFNAVKPLSIGTPRASSPWIISRPNSPPGLTEGEWALGGYYNFPTIKDYANIPTSQPAVLAIDDLRRLKALLDVDALPPPKPPGFPWDKVPESPATPAPMMVTPPPKIDLADQIAALVAEAQTLVAPVIAAARAFLTVPAGTRRQDLSRDDWFTLDHQRRSNPCR